MNFEKIEWYCTKCHKKGIILDLFVHPTVLLLRGACSHCGVQSSMRPVDLLSLAHHIDEPVPLPCESAAWKEEEYTVSTLDNTAGS